MNVEYAQKTNFEQSGNAVYDLTDFLGKKFPNLVIAQGFDNHLVMIFKLDDLFKRFDGKMARYEVHYRSLSTSIEELESYALVTSSENTYWLRKELKEIIDSVRDNKEVNIFNTLSIL